MGRTAAPTHDRDLSSQDKGILVFVPSPAALTVSVILSGAMGINMMQLQDVMDKRALGLQILLRVGSNQVLFFQAMLSVKRWENHFTRIRAQQQQQHQQTCQVPV